MAAKLTHLLDRAESGKVGALAAAPKGDGGRYGLIGGDEFGSNVVDSTSYSTGSALASELAAGMCSRSMGFFSMALKSASLRHWA